MRGGSVEEGKKNSADDRSVDEGGGVVAGGGGTVVESGTGVEGTRGIALWVEVEVEEEV